MIKKIFIATPLGVLNMSFDKAIEYGKEKRKPYKKAKAIDSRCRNHGTCQYCKENRLFKYTKKLLRLES